MEIALKIMMITRIINRKIIDYPSEYRRGTTTFPCTVIFVSRNYTLYVPNDILIEL